jgi:hypothetical protein
MKKSRIERLLKEKYIGHYMKVAPLVVLVIVTATAQAHEVRSCADVGVGIETLVTPVAKNVQSFYNNRVQIYNIDTIEPAAVSAGIAIVLPDNGDLLGSLKCLAILNFGAIDIKAARASYNPANGLSLSIPTRSPNFATGNSKPGPVLSLLINLQQASVKIVQDAKPNKIGEREQEGNFPRVYILARPPSSQIGVTFKQNYYWFSNSDEPCDITFDRACFIRSETTFVQLSNNIISINGGKAFGCSPTIIPDTSKLPGYDSGYGNCTEKGWKSIHN